MLLQYFFVIHLTLPTLTDIASMMISNVHHMYNKTLPLLTNWRSTNNIGNIVIICLLCELRSIREHWDRKNNRKRKSILNHRIHTNKIAITSHEPVARGNRPRTLTTKPYVLISRLILVGLLEALIQIPLQTNFYTSSKKYFSFLHVE